MDNIGAEVGQKMRSAIKAKLMELGCYVDDELPDYIMVMVANKRTKSQMNDDLQLFLTNKTAVFVDWLQIVLKKLKEITVTNPEIYKRVSKRKTEDTLKPAVKVKKEKKEKLKSNKKGEKKEPVKTVIKDVPRLKSLTDDLPVRASSLSGMRKIVVMQENPNSNSKASDLYEDSFDIPPLSEVAISNENELTEIEKKIKSVKSRLGLQIPSESEDEDFINLKAEPEDLFPIEHALNQRTKSRRLEENRKIKLVKSANSTNQHETGLKQRIEHPRIVFGARKKLSVLERLGKRPNPPNLEETKQKKFRISFGIAMRDDEKASELAKSNSEQVNNKMTGARVDKEDKHKRDEIENKKSVADRHADTPPQRESALKRLGVMSKVAVPQKEPVESEDEESFIPKEVPSTVKVTPRVIPPANNQANKNLLLKAVAEAQRSIAQTPVVGANSKPDALYTKKYREKFAQAQQVARKLSDKEKDKIKNILIQVDKKDRQELEFSSDDDDDNGEYVPKPIKKSTKIEEQLEYIPSSKEQISCNDSNNYAAEDNLDNNTEYNNFPRKSKGQTFIITLDGISRRQDKDESNSIHTKDSANNAELKTRDENKKRKSPIIFNAVPSSVVTKSKQIPDKLPIVFAQSTLKTKERCKYWPLCRQGEKCEFVHPSTPCKAFPQCKFGDKCLYIHPNCKFETSCTRKDCPYTHTPRNFSTVSATSPQMCKFFPNCSNTHCVFYHPKHCKYGKYCKNQLDCNFSHNFPTATTTTTTSKSNFTWRSTVKL